MATAFFDCYNGISGDMTLGAFIDLGADSNQIINQLQTLPLDDFQIHVERVKRCGVFASKANVICEEKNPPHRHLRHIKEMIENGELTDRVKQRSLQAFQILAEAEAEVHGTTIEKVHFHEVGAMDAIIDIVGSMIAAEQLKVDHAESSTVIVGSGTVNCQHGNMPVPAPATALILKNVPISNGPITKEMTTPTGAAILRTLCSQFGGASSLKVNKIGHGAGNREIEGHTNFLRVMLSNDSMSRTSPFINGLERRKLEQIITEIDDMSSEIYSSLMTQLYEHGALDVHFIPLQMKKNRPGIRVEILCDPESTADLLQTTLEETTTLGARVFPLERYCFHRKIETLETPLGDIRVKLALLDGAIRKASPEYEDCHFISIEKKIPLQRVFSTAIHAIEEKYFFSN